MNRQRIEKSKKELDFVERAERAFRRVAVKVKAENRKFGLKDAVWPTGR